MSFLKHDSGNGCSISVMISLMLFAGGTLSFSCLGVPAPLVMHAKAFRRGVTLGKTWSQSR